MARTHYVGAANESLAAAYFLERDYIVLWPMPQQSYIDFVTLKEGTFHRVQVKTATWNRSSGPWAYLQCRTRLTNTYQTVLPADIYDTLFVVNGDDCWIIPAATIDSSNLSLMSDNPATPPSRWAVYKDKLIKSRPATIREYTC